MLTIDEKKIAHMVTAETGLSFSSRSKLINGEQRITLKPAGYSKSNTFSIEATIGWRHIEVIFIPGSFSGDLLNIMRDSTVESKNLFVNILDYCQCEGASVNLKIDNKIYDFKDESYWGSEWHNFLLGIRIGQLNLSNDLELDTQTAFSSWTGRMAAAVLSLMPMEVIDSDIEKYPEGASVSIKVNRYERDPRNRAAALSIHGYRCKGCGLLMMDKYGQIASGFIEVHHLNRISDLGDDYLIDPLNDLIPLCPNCHSIVHLRTPPLSLAELNEITGKTYN